MICLRYNAEPAVPIFFPEWFFFFRLLKSDILSGMFFFQVILIDKEKYYEVHQFCIVLTFDHSMNVIPMPTAAL